jgi:hypothetical protein
MSDNTEELKEEWIQSWMAEFNKLVKEEGIDWIEKIKEWELNNPAPKPSGPIITIPKMDTKLPKLDKQQKAE